MKCYSKYSVIVYVRNFVFSLLLTSNSFGQTIDKFVDSLETVINVENKLIPIKDNFYLLQPQTKVPAGNITVFTGKSNLVLVDNQWAKLGPGIQALIQQITPKPITYIINTHYHFDHVNGNKFFGRMLVPIVAHKNLRNRLANDQRLSSTSGFQGKLLQRAFPPEALPTITFQDTLELYDEWEKIRIIHFKNAHTDGDAIVHFSKADIYCTGDIFVTYGIPYFDEDNGGDIYENLKTIDHLISASNEKTLFIPGHGPVCTKKDLIDYKNLLLNYKNKTLVLMRKNIPLDKILNEVKIDEWLDGFRDELIPHIYRMALKHNELKSKP